MDEAGRHSRTMGALWLEGPAPLVLPLATRHQAPWFDPWLVIPALGTGLVASGLAIVWSRGARVQRVIACGLCCLHLLLVLAAAWLSRVSTFG